MFDKVLNSPLDTPPLETHCVKSVRIQSISPYSVRMRKKTEQNNSEYGHFSHSGIKGTTPWLIVSLILVKILQ